MTITFDPEPHKYYAGRIVVPSVTQILDAFRLRPQFYPPTDFHRRRGTAVHHATVLIDEQTYDPDSTSGLIQPFAQSYIDFLADFQPTVISSEEIVFSEEFWYAGMLDRRYRWKDGTEATVDFKSAATRNQRPPKATALQTAAYTFAKMKASFNNVRRFALTLSPDGYRLWEEYTNPADYNAWLSFATAYRWQQENAA